MAVSTGLLQAMGEEEVEAVLGHEVGHVANGDMITLTLITGVVNTFVLFLARIVGFFVDRVVMRNEEGLGIGYFITTIAAELVLGILASTIVAWFSRRREFRADVAGAELASRGGSDPRPAEPAARPGDAGHHAGDAHGVRHLFRYPGRLQGPAGHPPAAGRPYRGVAERSLMEAQGRRGPVAVASCRVRSLVRATLLASAAAFLAGPALGAESWNGRGGLQVTGRGEVEVVPDLARLPMVISIDGSDPAEVKREVDGRTRKVLAMLASLTIKDRDITARQVRVQPRYRYDKGRNLPAGFTAARTIDVVVRDLDQLGSVMDRALGAGVTQLGNSSYDHSERERYLKHALDAAIEDARAQAAHLASQFGVRVGVLLEARTQRPGGGVEPLGGAQALRMSAEASAMPLAPGVLRLTRTVDAAFAIKAEAER